MAIKGFEIQVMQVHIFLDYVMSKHSSLEEHIMYSMTPEVLLDRSYEHWNTANAEPMPCPSCPNRHLSSCLPHPPCFHYH